MLTDNRHAQIGTILAAILLRNRVTIVTCLVRAPTGLAEQRLPLFIGQTTAIPIGSCVFSAMVKKTNVVVLILERFNFSLDEIIEYR